MTICSKEDNYMLAEFSSSNDGHIFTKWLSRVQAIQVSASQQNPFVLSIIYLSRYLQFFFFQFCSQSSCILVDDKQDLFVPFHSIIVKAITSVVDACTHIMWPKGKYNNLNLRHWLKCDFIGMERFEDVKGKLMPKVCSVVDYFDFILQIHQLNYFILVNERNQKYVTVSFNMSFDCFDKFNQSTYFDFKQEELCCDVENKEALEVKSQVTLDNKATLHNEAVALSADAGANLDNEAVALSSDAGANLDNEAVALSADAVAETVLLDTDHSSVSRDEEFEVETEMLRDDVVEQEVPKEIIDIEDMIDEMYHKAQMLAKDGHQGVGLPPPKEALSCISCEKILYMEAEFVDAVTNKPFKKWLTKVEPIKVIIDVVAHYLYHGYLNLFINVSFLS
jgi:hypothetical protein